MNSEEERVQQIMRDISEGNLTGEELVFDQRRKRLRPANNFDDPSETMSVTPEDLEMFGARGRAFL